MKRSNAHLNASGAWGAYFFNGPLPIHWSRLVKSPPFGMIP